MKTTWWNTFLCLIILIKIVNAQGDLKINKNDAIIDKYVKEQLKRATRSLEKSFEKKIRVKKSTQDSDVSFHEQFLQINNQPYSPFLKLAQTHNFNTVYAVDERNILKFNENNLEHIITFKHEKIPVFVEVVNWMKNILLFLVKFENDFVYVYQSTIDQNPVQTIKLSVTSVKCFHRQDIYCMFVTQSGNGKTDARLFKWVETHFDVQENLEVPHVSSIIAFKWKTDDLILLAPKYGEGKASLLLQWNGINLKKVQNMKFQTSCRDCLKYFQFQTKFYVVSDKTVLVWNGHRLVQVGSLDRKPEFGEPTSLDVWSNDNRAVVFVFYKHYIVVHKVWDKFRVGNYRKVKENIASAIIVNSSNDENSFITYSTLFKNRIYLQTIPFSVKMQDEDVVGSQLDPLMQCFSSLQNAMLVNRENIKKLESEVPSILRIDTPQNYSGVLKVGVATKVRSGTVSNGQKNFYYLTSPTELLQTVVELQNKAGNLNSMRDHFLYKSRPNTISVNVYVPGGVSTIEGNLGSASVSMATGLDGIVFLDRPSAPDSMESVLVAQSIKAHHLYTAPGTIVDDLLLSAGDQKITGIYSGTNLVLNNILPSPGLINDVPIENLVEANDGIVYGTKTVQNLFVNNMNATLFNQVDTLSWIENMNSEFEGNLAVYENISVKNLDVEYLNGIKWNDFLKTLYLDIDGHSKIEGDLIIKSRSRVHSGHLQSIFGIPVENIFTKTTDQVITSNITIQNLHVEEVVAGSINSLNFKEAIAAPGTNIRNVEIEHLNVEHDLTLNDDSLFDKQIPGTKLFELLQIYNGKVLIKGSVTIPNLHLESDAKVYLQDSPVFMNIPQYYWTKTNDQVIKSNVTFVKNVKTPQVYLDKVNSQNWSRYITKDGELSTFGHLIFSQAEIGGNLNFDRSNVMYDPFLQVLYEHAVRLTGKCTIQGDVEFTGEADVKDANVQILDGIPVSDLVSKTDTKKKYFKCSKTVPYMNVSTLMANDACAASLNGVDLKKYFDNLLKIDEPASFGELNIDSLAAEYINLEELKTIDAANVGKGNEQYRSYENDGESPKVIRINGSVHIKEIKNLQSVNGIDLAEYLDMVVLKDSNKQIGGRKIFTAPVTILEELTAPEISGVNLYDLYNYGLTKSTSQNITGHYEILNIKTDNLFANYVNNINTEQQLIDISISNEINSPVWFKSPLSVQNMIWNSQCFVNSSNLYEMPNKKWKLMYIQNQLQHPELTKVLENIVENAVTDGFAKNITGKVRFTGAVTFDNIITTNYINNVNLDYIAQDALFKHSSDVKHISCSKTFISPIVLSQGEVLGDFDAFIINGVKIGELNESLVWKNEDAVITGSKILKQNVFVDDLIVEGLVNSVAVNDVVFFENDRPIPNIVFNTLHIKDNLQVQDINGRNLDEFLSKRVRLRGDAQNVSAHVQFAKLNIAGPSFVSKINNISLDEVVFTDVATSDTITGMKVFEKGLKVYGDISAKFLNDFHLQTTYSNSIRKNKDYYISHVVFNNPVQLLNGLYAHAYENQTWLNFYAKPFLDNTFAQEMDTKLNYTFNSIKPYYHYLYLEPSEIRILEPPSKKVETIRPGFLQLSNDVSGEVCYLPQFCPCSVQYTVDISNQRSISILPGNATHRVFSYHDDGIGINIFTNSISTSAFCSTANEELTYVTWMEPQRETPDSTPIGDITIDQKYYNGYLSDAKFFRDRSSRIFLVLAMYYDKSSDSHDIDSLLLELNMTTRETHIVQYIPTRSATTLELLQSPFGTHLVICNAVQNEDIQAYFEIMKYDQENYQFKPVRTVSTEGCGLMASAVFGKEQFIFVGDENYKILRINRYIEQLDMFHYFQSFIYESYLRGLHIFYPQNSKKGEVLLCVTTDNGNFYIYDYTYIEGWKQISTGYLKNVHDVTHFQLNHEEFLFMSSTYKNMVFRIIRQGIP